VLVILWKQSFLNGHLVRTFFIAVVAWALAYIDMEMGYYTQYTAIYIPKRYKWVFFYNKHCDLCESGSRTP
jgi:hypothetical protein